MLTVVAKPRFMWDIVDYHREEKDGYLNLISRNAPSMGSYMLNPSARRVVDLANGERSMSQIYAEFAATYEGVTVEMVKEDVNEVFRQLGHIGLICWEGGYNPLIRVPKEVKLIDDKSNLEAILAEESHIREISEYLESTLGTPESSGRLIVKSPVLFNNADYTDLAIRSKLFNYQEFFCLFRRYNQTVGLFGVITSPVQLSSRTAHLSILILDEGVDRKDCARLLKRALNQMNDYVISKNFKVRCYLAQNQWELPSLMQFLCDIGFKEEGVLKDEMGPGCDLLLLACWL